MKKLGLNLHVTGWCVDCRLSALEAEAVLVHLVEQIEMDTGGLPAKVWHFPINGGQGGEGFTVAQPLVESIALGLQPVGAMVADIWSEHHHSFFLIASCNPYDKRTVGDWLHSHVGRVISFGEFDLFGRGGHG